MPLATLVLQLAVDYFLAKQLVNHPRSSAALAPFLGFASGSAAALVGFVIWLGGLLIVYNGTQDAVLTLGYLVVRWVESFLLNAILTASLLASIGLPNFNRITGALRAARPPAITRPVLTPGSAPSSTARPAEAITVTNAQGLPLTLTNRLLSISLPVGMRVNAQFLFTLRSRISLRCTRPNGTGSSLPPHELPHGTFELQWELSKSQTTINSCSGNLVVARSTRPPINEGITIHNLDLAPWKLQEH
jgi:hypothetical protein